MWKVSSLFSCLLAIFAVDVYWSPNRPSGLHILVIEYSNGTSEKLVVREKCFKDPDCLRYIEKKAEALIDYESDPSTELKAGD